MKTIFAFLSVFLLVGFMTAGAFAQEAGMESSPSSDAPSAQSTDSSSASEPAESVTSSDTVDTTNETVTDADVEAEQGDVLTPTCMHDCDDDGPILIPGPQFDDITADPQAEQGPALTPTCMQGQDCDDDGPILIPGPQFGDIEVGPGSIEGPIPCPGIIDIQTGEESPCPDGDDGGDGGGIVLLPNPIPYQPHGDDPTINSHSQPAEPKPCMGITDMQTGETKPCPIGNGDPNPTDTGGTQNATLEESTDSPNGGAPLFSANPLWIPTQAPAPNPSVTTLETPAGPAQATLESAGPDPAVVALADGRIQPEATVPTAPAPAPTNPITGLFTGANAPLIGIGILAILGIALYARGRKSA